MRYLDVAGYRTLAGGNMPRRRPQADFEGDDRTAAETARDAAITDAAAYDAEPLAVTLSILGVRDPIFQVRRDGAWVDVLADDTERVEKALDLASGECRAWLPDDLFSAVDGSLVDPPPQRVAEVLPGIVFDLAIYRLTDGATGAEDPIAQRYHAARKLLREGLKAEPERPEVQAELVDGTSQFLPGAADDDADDAGEAW